MTSLIKSFKVLSLALILSLPSLTMAMDGGAAGDVQEWQYLPAPAALGIDDDGSMHLSSLSDDDAASDFSDADDYWGPIKEWVTYLSDEIKRKPLESTQYNICLRSVISLLLKRFPGRFAATALEEISGKIAAQGYLMVMPDGKGLRVTDPQVVNVVQGIQQMFAPALPQEGGHEEFNPILDMSPLMEAVDAFQPWYKRKPLVTVAVSVVGTLAIQSMFKRLVNNR